MTRYKATIILSSPKQNLSKLPSTTLIVGAYGDIVNYNNGTYYFSWYPSCKIGEALDENLSLLKEKVKTINKENVINETLLELEKFVPFVKSFQEIKKAGILGGGYICGWAKTDITDPQSGLHKRSDIGIHSHGSWVSINTGKYCTGPQFGLQAAEAIINAL